VRRRTEDISRPAVDCRDRAYHGTCIDPSFGEPGRLTRGVRRRVPLSADHESPRLLGTTGECRRSARYCHRRGWTPCPHANKERTTPVPARLPPGRIRRAPKQRASRRAVDTGSLCSFPSELPATSFLRDGVPVPSCLISCSQASPAGGRAEGGPRGGGCGPAVPMAPRKAESEGSALACGRDEIAALRSPNRAEGPALRIPPIATRPANVLR
jgi:hypothetical protein